MSSELARQLAGHRAKYVVSNSINQGKASLFLSLKEAAGVDVEVVHEAAVKHATILSQYDGRFAGFLDTILHESSISYQRELKTAQENKVLDKQLDELMELLSVFALEPSAHLVLEYLIRRYAVQEYNVHTLIRCFLHVHDSKIFARIIQLCNLTVKNNSAITAGGKDTMWLFLSDVKNTGVPLLRATLIQQLTTHSTTNNDHSLLLLQAICDSVRKCKKIQSTGDVSDLFYQGLISKISWFTCVILELTPASNPRASLTDQQLRIVYPVLDDSFGDLLVGNPNSIEGSEVRFKYPNLFQQECWKMAVVLLAHVSARTTFAAALLQSIVSKMFVTLRCLFEADPSSTDNEIDGYTTDIMGVLSVLARTQKMSIKWSALMSLAGAADEVSTDNILRLFGDIKRLFAGEAGESLVKALTLCLLSKWKSTLADAGEEEEISGGKTPKGKGKTKESGARRQQLQNMTIVGQLLSNALAIQLLCSDGLLRYLLLFLYSVNHANVPAGGLSVASVTITTTLMKQIAQKYDGVFTSSINSFMAELRLESEESQDSTRRERFEGLLRDVFCDNLSAQPQQLGEGEGAGQEAVLGSLFVALKSNISVVRGQAIKRLLECYPLPVVGGSGSSAGSPGVLSAVMELFDDHDAGFAAQLWSQAPAVLQRVHAYSGVNDNDTISSSVMLDTVRVAWDHWIAAVPMYPREQGGDILLALVDSLCSTEVLDILLSSTETVETAGVSSQCWMFMACIRLAHGIVPASLHKSAQHRDLAEKLSVAAIKLCGLLGGVNSKKHVYVSLLKPASSKSTASVSGVQTIAACLVSNLVAMSGSGSDIDDLSVFVTAMQCAYRFATWANDSAQHGHHGWGYVESLLLILQDSITAAHEQLGAKKSAAGAVSAVEFLLTNQLPLLLTLCPIFEVRHTANASTLSAQTLQDSISASLKCCKHNSLTSPLFSSKSDGLGSLSACSLSGRVLVALLAQNNGGVVLALETFFGESGHSNMFAVLNAIAFYSLMSSSAAASTLSALDSQFFVPCGVKISGVWGAVSSDMTAPVVAGQMVDITTDARVGALLTLSALLHSVLSAGTIEASVLSTLVPFVLTSCADVDAATRTAATAICSTVLSCVNSVDTSAEIVGSAGATGKKSSKSSSDSNSVLFSDVLRLFTAISEHGAEVSLTRQAARESLQKLLNSSEARDKASNDRLFGWFVSLCSGSASQLHPRTVSLLLHSVCVDESAGPSSFDMSKLWNCVSAQLKDVTTSSDADADAELRATLINSFGCFFASSGKGIAAIQESVFMWVSGTIAQSCQEIRSAKNSADTERTLLWCNDILAAMEESKWCVYALIAGHKTEAVLYKNIVDLYLHGAQYNETAPGVYLVYSRKLIVSILKQLWQVDLSFVSTQVLEPILTALLQTTSTDAEDEVEDSSSSSSSTSGSLSLIMQHACNALELLVDCTDSVELFERFMSNSAPDSVAVHISAFVRMLGEVLQCCINNRTTRFRALPSTEYCVSLALELLCKALGYALQKNLVLLGDAPVTKGKKSKSTVNTPVKPSATITAGDGVLLTSSYIHDMITIVLRGIYECSLLSVKTAGLQCLEMAIRHSATVGDSATRAATVDSCIRTLSKLLAGSTLALTNSHAAVDTKPWNHTIISQILDALLSVSSVGSGATDAASSYAVMYDILSGYCAHFASMQASQRYWYLQLCVDALNDNCRTAAVEGQEKFVLPAATAVLLSQAFLNQQDGDGRGSVGNGEEVGLILLSRNAAKNHRQSLVASKSEELFQLAVNLSSPSADAMSALKGSGNNVAADKLDNVVTVSQSCVGMLKFVSSGSKQQASNSIMKICNSAANMFTPSAAAVPSSEQSQGTCSLLLLLHLEYLLEVLENRSFHRYISILKLQATESETDNNAVQTMFFHFFEHLLELFTFSSQMQLETDSEATIEVPMKGGAGSVSISLKSFLVTVKSWCCKIIKALQKLLDMPVFIAILLELLSYEAEDGAISSQLQEQAIVILTDRLDYLMNSTSSSSRLMVKEAEKTLLLDLYNQLKTIIFDGLGAVLKPTTATPSKGKKLLKDSFLQSAVMCLDILTRYLGADTSSISAGAAPGVQKWGTMFLDTLVQFMPFVTAVTDNIVASSTSDNAVLKVAGSLFLCTSTLVSSVVARRSSGSSRNSATANTNTGGGAAKVLPYLASIMTQYHSAFMHLQSQCATSVLDSPSPATVNITPECLVLRSLLASFGVLFQSISAYLHVHMHSVLHAILTAYQNFNLMLIQVSASPSASQSAVVELSAILIDIQSLVSTVLSTVSPRLGCPVLAQYLSPKEEQAYVHIGDHAMRLLVYVLGSGGNGLKVGKLINADVDVSSSAMEVTSQSSSNQLVLEGIFRSKYHRAIVQDNMSVLSQIALLLLDYRRVGFSADTDADDVVVGALDTDICNCVVELCLKWTENELSNFVTRALVWKNSEVSTSVGKRLRIGAADEDSNGAVATAVSADRAIVFFHLLSVLSNRLQVIFTPTMISGTTMAWGEMVQALQSVSDACEVEEEDGEDGSQLQLVSGGSKKKRKMRDRAPLKPEVTELCKYVMLCVQGVATHHMDNTAIDTAKYESVMPLLVSLVPYWSLFSSVVSADVLISTLTALAKSVNKDLLWKPMNYKLLMLTRPTRSVGRGKHTSSTTNFTSTRLLAIKILHQLFIDVGEDYLMLLPECLPFLSECLEDPNKDLVHYTSKFIQYIETLSGEKLDAYLV